MFCFVRGRLASRGKTSVRTWEAPTYPPASLGSVQYPQVLQSCQISHDTTRHHTIPIICFFRILSIAGVPLRFCMLGNFWMSVIDFTPVPLPTVEHRARLSRSGAFHGANREGGLRGLAKPKQAAAQAAGYHRHHAQPGEI